MDPSHFQLQSPSRATLPKGQHSLFGIIPGPKNPWDADSFLYPLVRELLELVIGMSAYDALSRSLFALHAYVIASFGDIPTVSVLMHMKGHNGLCPCRMCSILAICIPDSRNKTLYVPLSRRNHPTPTDVVEYRSENLPLRSHNQFTAQAKAVESAPIEIQRELQTFFWQLQSIVAIPIPRSKELKMKEPQNLCLAVIRQVHATLPNAHGVPPIPFYSQSGALDPTDIKSIQCIVGRVEDRRKWGLVDRSGPLAHAVFTEAD
jgi:hypothetical protein